MNSLLYIMQCASIKDVLDPNLMLDQRTFSHDEKYSH